MRIHALFFSSNTDAPTLHRQITPTVEQRAQQQERWKDLRDFLIGDLEAATELAISSWLQGSYKFGTQIRPARKGGEFDIDLGIYFEWAGPPDVGAYLPRDLKTLTQQSLLDYARDAEEDVVEVLVPPKERCSRIRFAGGFHIDVPTYHLDRDADARRLATERRGWEESDPKAFYVWFYGLFADDDHAQVRRLIRYFKMWAALQLEEPPSSVMLTVLVANAYLTLRAGDLDGDDLALRSVAAAIRETLQREPRVENPVDKRENLNRLPNAAFVTLLNALDRLVRTADGALAAPTEMETAHVWSAAFHHFFPVPAEQDSGQGHKALVPLAFDPQVSVVATPRTGGPSWRMLNAIGPIPIECDIEFTLDNAHQLPAGARVQWMVRNAGEHAEAENDLGHLAGEGVEVVKHSAYNGTHFMDVTAMSAFGQLLGFRRIPVRISAVRMPPRNPKRPGWTRFRSRR